eukprot:Protomagalhaensia_sp_Gyna_25__2488@NODE_2396_length_1107_cov_1319_676030_g1986_i0_p1_GENE_NODE_2396_length_1107_cov_1319_676030_g1986_i0NODE_2396_length_1107_cov_1319_676030_g1986_i0_p1_ORF_typecomplete_len233_score21_82BsuBI_PstI_RE_N/PF17728_1/0_12_NODE_2396_length_1107_cov_1319_676030_g1986_i0269967
MMNSLVGSPSNASRMGSLASIGQPMSVQRSDPASGTVYFERSDTSTVQVHAMPPKFSSDSQNLGTGMVKLSESRQVLTPMVAGPQTVNSNVWQEDLQPTYSTRSYETVRRDISQLFPGANIVSVGQAGVIQTPLGSVYNPRDNTFYSRLTNQTTYVEPASTQYTTTATGYSTTAGTNIPYQTIPAATASGLTTTHTPPTASTQFQVLATPGKPNYGTHYTTSSSNTYSAKRY